MSKRMSLTKNTNQFTAGRTFLMCFYVNIFAGFKKAGVVSREAGEQVITPQTNHNLCLFPSLSFKPWDGFNFPSNNQVNQVRKMQTQFWNWTERYLIWLSWRGRRSRLKWILSSNYLWRSVNVIEGENVSEINS